MKNTNNSYLEVFYVSFQKLVYNYCHVPNILMIWNINVQNYERRKALKLAMANVIKCCIKNLMA